MILPGVFTHSPSNSGTQLGRVRAGVDNEYLRARILGRLNITAAGCGSEEPGNSFTGTQVLHYKTPSLKQLEHGRFGANFGLGAATGRVVAGMVRNVLR